MNRLKPRIPLDKTILAKINEYYRWNLGSRVLYRDCFSHPALDMHACNPLAHLEGGDKCSFCNHAPGGICKITCHISRYCLAAFAYRLGIGEGVFAAAMAKNLGISYQDLLSKVRAVLNGEVEDDGAAQDLVKIESTPVERNEEPPVVVVRQEAGMLDSEGNELLTIPQATELFGCGYHSMYAKVMKLKEGKVVIGKKVYVRKADVIKMKEKKKGRTNGQA